MKDTPQMGEGPPKWKPGQCILKVAEIPKYEIGLENVGRLF